MSEDVTLVMNSKGLNEMSRFLLKALRAFILDPSSGLKNMGWPLYEPHENTLVSIGKDRHIGAPLGSSTAYPLWASIGEIYFHPVLQPSD
jgi:hypothetical protein